MQMTDLVRQLLIGISSGMVTFLMAAGVSLVISGMNIINFGQGAFFILGAFLCYTIVHIIGFWWALLLGPLAVAILGGLTELLLRPLYGKSMLYQLLLTMGVAFVITDGMSLIWGFGLRVVIVPHLLSSSITIVGIDFPVYYLFIIVISGLVALGLRLMFSRTKLGMLFRAIISDREMVGNLGTNVQLLYTVMFMFGVGLSGLAGVLMAPIVGISVQQSMTILFSVMTVLIIGGIASMSGAFLAALVVGLVNAFGSMFLPWFYSLLPAVLMIVVLLVRPQGLFARES
jgi:branched-subunit amino acid ABC-type transport system permease component